MFLTCTIIFTTDQSRNIKSVSVVRAPPHMSHVQVCLSMSLCIRQIKHDVKSSFPKKSIQVQCRALHHHGLLLLAGGKKRRLETHSFSTLQMVIFSNHVIDIWLINTIGNVHDASQCADSDDPFGRDNPGDCCGVHIDDRQCRNGNGYKVSSMSFEECQKTDEGCSFSNSCFSCVLSPPGKDSSHPVPAPLQE